MVDDSRDQMSKLVFGVSEEVVKECRMAMLVNEMDLTRLMLHAQYIKEKNIKEEEGDNKVARTASFNLS